MAHASNGTDRSDGTDLRAISHPSRSCRSRILNAAQSLRVETAEELLDRAESQPGGLRSLKRLHNFGDRPLRGLETFQSRLRTLLLQTGGGETGLVVVQSGPTAGFTFAGGEMREIDYLIDGAAAMARRHEELRAELGL